MYRPAKASKRSMKCSKSKSRGSQRDIGRTLEGIGVGPYFEELAQIQPIPINRKKYALFAVVGYMYSRGAN